MAKIRFIKGDCLQATKELPRSEFDLIYLDPPFFTQKDHTLSSRDGDNVFAFSDTWSSYNEYSRFLSERLRNLYDLLSLTGSLFFHCDRNSAHIARFILDEIFGHRMFQSEIIWTYRRWSNSKKGLLPAHQNILFYSKSDNFKFNSQETDYSESTNLDQILQKRSRDERNKSVYARNEAGEVVSNGSKKGVPLSDVWDIPYLNPKANERVGYPTQKPILLLERIINLCTDEDDWVLDPFCGSGTTVIASKLLNRNAIGIDISEDAVNLSLKREDSLIKTESNLLKIGRSQYSRSDLEILNYIKGIDHFVVQRNKGIDAILKQHVAGQPVFIRIQREGETKHEAAAALRKAAREKGSAILVVVVIEENDMPFIIDAPDDIHFINSASFSIKRLLSDLSSFSTASR